MGHVHDRALAARPQADGPPAATWPGGPHPLGATPGPDGTNFSLFSEAADGVELCLFDAAGAEERRIACTEVEAHVWHVFLPGEGPGRRYGWRVHGPWEPARGLRCNPAKLLLDPYAKAIEGGVDWDPACFDYAWGNESEPSDLDSAPHVPKSIVYAPTFDWGDDRPPATPLHESVIYEVHVKGFTARHPGVPEELRGTYAGFAHDAAIEHLLGLGVTAVELLPVHQFVHDMHLLEKGLRNYWGYNSIGFFAPHDEYAAAGRGGEQVYEFKAMVRRLHAAGIEVILDVVYNHTAEGNHLGPVLSFKGIDNAAYYRLVPDDPRHYFDTTGTGNSLNARNPHVLQMVLDSLRYWVLEMRVDGFRFDLAATLARELHAVDRLAAFFDLIQADPVVSQVKLIAEPWDLGEGGYQVGNFPPLWSEWNGKYRDTLRDFWRGRDETLGELALRLTGSPDLYADDGRHPMASVNFVTAHDGFTLHDLVTYDRKRNEANGEENRDGSDDDGSWNHGVEGETDDPAVNALRARQVRNHLAALLLSQGVPMILGGDEIGRTQGGNNNAYCQDNETSWFDWERAKEFAGLRETVARLVALRRAHPVFRRRRWFQGRPIRGTDDVGWYRPDGSPMTDADWEAGFAKSLAMFLSGDGIAAPDARGRRVRDDSFLVLFNAHDEALDWTLPGDLPGPWDPAVDTAADVEDAPRLESGAGLRVEARSVRVFVRAR